MPRGAGLRLVRDVIELDRYAADWDRLSAGLTRFYPTYSSALEELGGKNFLVIVAGEPGAVKGMACFVSDGTLAVFNVGERRLFSMGALETRLYGQSVLGGFDSQSLHECLAAGLGEWPCDVFTLGEIESGSELHADSAWLPRRFVRTRRQRKDPVHWLIRLPTTFEAYLGQLRTSTRKALLYEMRRFGRELNFAHEVITRPDQVEAFLQDGEAISRTTYQWNVGERLVADESTLRRYSRLAHEGRLRCHILRVDGQPCAFTRGEIAGPVYNFETPGFTAKYAKYSPGVVLLMWTVRDLIENTSCSLFDFGPGGDDEGYKARFGNWRVPCTDLQFANIRQRRGVLLLAAHWLLSGTKDIASTMVGRGPLRQRLKHAIRTYGD